jgi:hypothetical protein
LRKFPKDYKLLTISIANTKKNWVAAVTTNTKSSFKGVGKWGSREVGKWGNGEMGEWGISTIAFPVRKRYTIDVEKLN